MNRAVPGRRFTSSLGSFLVLVSTTASCHVLASAFASTRGYRPHSPGTTYQHWRHSRLAYANAVDPPLDHHASTPHPSVTNRPLGPSVRLPASPLVTDVTTLDELHAVILDGRTQGHLVAVQWYAPWCRACHRTSAAFSALSRQSNRDQVRYVKVSAVNSPSSRDTARRTNMHAAMGIVRVPYSHVYHPTAGLVEELRLSNATLVAALAHIVQSYVQGYCPLSPHVDPATGVYAAPYPRVP